MRRSEKKVAKTTNKYNKRRIDNKKGIDRIWSSWKKKLFAEIYFDLFLKERKNYFFHTTMDIPRTLLCGIFSIEISREIFFGSFSRL